MNFKLEFFFNLSSINYVARIFKNFRHLAILCNVKFLKSMYAFPGVTDITLRERAQNTYAFKGRKVSDLLGSSAKI
jgi:hypothetical protein